MRLQEWREETLVSTYGACRMSHGRARRPWPSLRTLSARRTRRRNRKVGRRQTHAKEGETRMRARRTAKRDARADARIAPATCTSAARRRRFHRSLVRVLVHSRLVWSRAAFGCFVGRGWVACVHYTVRNAHHVRGSGVVEGAPCAWFRFFCACLTSPSRKAW